MFSLTSLKDLHLATCPELGICKRDPCLFSHEKHAPKPAPPASSTVVASGSATAAPANPQQKRVLPPLDDFSKFDSKKRTKVSPPAGQPGATSSANGNASASSSTSSAPILKLQNFTVMGSHTPHENRMKIVKLYFDAFNALYSGLSEPAQSKVMLASEHASAQEACIYKASNKYTYKNMAAQALTRLKKLPPPSSRAQAGTLEELDKRKAASQRIASMKINQDQLRQLTLDKQDMSVWGKDFVLDIPETDPMLGQTEEGQVKDCSRCKKGFVVKPGLDEREMRECEHHWGKPFMDGVGVNKQRLWSCCKMPTTSTAPWPCSQGPHVFAEADPVHLHARQRFRRTKDISSAVLPLDVVALDCELVYTTAGISLARVTVVSESRQTVFDAHIRPDPAHLLDTNFRFSGVNSEDLQPPNAKYTLSEVQQKLGEFIGPQTILLGHGIENDLKALRLVHPIESLVDTSVLFPHPMGPPRRLGLRILAKQHLGQFIQDTGSHDSKDDSLATLDLVRFKLSKMS